jgi:hypothetical protein
MAAPAWGNFMKKVYADPKTGYGKMLKFEEPPELQNDPVYADANFENYLIKGDSLMVEELNYDGSDFFGSDFNPPANPPKKDTGKQKKSGNADSANKTPPPPRNDY